MCASECVCLHVCVLGGYKGEEGGQEKEQNFLFCVVLCSLVFLGGRAQQKGENPNHLSALPSFRTLLHPPCSLTYLQDPVEWAEMASRVKRATQTDGPQCGDVCPTEKEKEWEKERWSQDHLSVTLTLSPLFSLSSSLAEGHHSAQTGDKDVQCAFWRKEVSVSTTALTACFNYCVCLGVCAAAAGGWDADHT